MFGTIVNVEIMKAIQDDREREIKRMLLAARDIEERKASRRTSPGKVNKLLQGLRLKIGRQAKPSRSQENVACS